MTLILLNGPCLWLISSRCVQLVFFTELTPKRGFFCSNRVTQLRASQTIHKGLGLRLFKEGQIRLNKGLRVEGVFGTGR